MLQRIQSNILHFQVEPFTLNILDCKDYLTITFILLLPCKMRQVLTYISSFKRELLAIFFFSIQKTGMEKWAGKGRTQRCLGAVRFNRQQRKWAMGMHQLFLFAAHPDIMGESPGSTRGCIPFGTKDDLHLAFCGKQGRKCLQRIFL